MKLRLSLTLTFERAKPDREHESAPEVDTTGAVILERAEPAPIGFVIPEHRSDPFEDRHHSGGRT